MPDTELLGSLYDLPVELLALDPSAAHHQQGEPGITSSDSNPHPPGASVSEPHNGAKLESVPEFAEPSADGTAESSSPAEHQQQQQQWSQSGATCVTCGIGIDLPGFESPEEQREHFRGDWHRCNLKRRLGSRAVLSEAEFEALLAQGGDEVESISGSDTDSDDDGDGTAQQRRSQQRSGPKVIFTRPDGSRFAVWRCLLESAGPRGLSAVPEGGPASASASLGHDEQSLLQQMVRLRSGGTAARWMVVLASGGHFAAAIFQWREGKATGGGSKGGGGSGAQQEKRGPAALEVLQHKTFHKYVVRAKAGGRQSSKDGSGKSIKSAGSALRRANEAALAKDIRTTLDTWKQEMEQVGLVFVHSSRADTGTLFVGDGAPLSRSDPRVRRIPFATRRPTLAEVKRVATVLAHVWELGAAAPVPVPPRANKDKEIKGAAPTPSTAAPETRHAAEVEEQAAPAVPDSALHTASKEGNHEEVKRLLEDEGADPCQLDARGKTPYAVALDKPTRDAFRRFMATEPDRWDYHVAGVPSALTAELEEQQDAKKAEKDAKRREKERERKKAAKERKKAGEEQAKATAAAEVEAAAAQAAAQAARLQLGDKKKKGGGGQGKKVGGSAADDATKRREQMAAAAEARMKALGAASNSQKLY